MDWITPPLFFMAIKIKLFLGLVKELPHFKHHFQRITLRQIKQLFTSV